MTYTKNRSLNTGLFIMIFGVFLTPYISSCGKGGSTSAIGSNTQLEVLNLSPDVHPVNLYLGFVKQNSYVYNYPYPSGYFQLTTIDTPLQVRSASSATMNLFSISNPNFKSNHKYTLFITGQYSTTGKVDSFLTEDDTTATPPVGFGKIRFINLSIPNTPIDVVANGATVFHAIPYLVPSAYQVVPVGNYAFQFIPTGSSSALTTTAGTSTIQDGRLYTLYSYGIVGRTDTSAFNAGLLINR